MPCDINNPLRKPPRYSDLHVSQTLPKTNKLNKVSSSASPAHSLGPPTTREDRPPVTEIQWLWPVLRMRLLLQMKVPKLVASSNEPRVGLLELPCLLQLSLYDAPCNRSEEQQLSQGISQRSSIPFAGQGHDLESNF